MSDYSTWTLPAGGIGGILLVKAWDWWLSRKSSRAAENSNAALLDGMAEQMQRTNARLSAIDERLTQEIKARIQAQEDAAMLRVRIRILEHVLRTHGITMPPELDEPTRDVGPVVVVEAGK